MKIRYGQIVKLKSSNELYKVEGYQERMIVSGGNMNKVTQYKLKSMNRDETIIRNVDEILLENLTIVDCLLDQFNDYMHLYEVLNDEMYLDKAKNIIEKLKQETK